MRGFQDVIVNEQEGFHPSSLPCNRAFSLTLSLILFINEHIFARIHAHLEIFTQRDSLCAKEETTHV